LTRNQLIAALNAHGVTVAGQGSNPDATFTLRNGLYYQGPWFFVDMQEGEDGPMIGMKDKGDGVTLLLSEVCAIQPG
jgi:hypothetical protein